MKPVTIIQNKLTRITLIAFLLSAVYCLLFTTAFAQETSYTLLEPIPTVSGGAQTTVASQYISGIFTLAISAAIVLAVIMIIFGGIKYMSTDAFSGKNEAKGTINDAIWGLALALGAWLILSTINPNLVNFNLSIDRQQIPPNTGGSVPTPSIPSTGAAWPDDSNIRSMINSGITYNRTNNCTVVGQTACTSVNGLGSRAVNGLNALYQNCLNCSIEITGGTEYWLHGNNSTDMNANPTQHKPGFNVLDLGKDGGLNSHITSKGTQTVVAGCSNLGAKYLLGGAVYVDEGTHWHVCY